MPPSAAQDPHTPTQIKCSRTGPTFTSSSGDSPTIYTTSPAVPVIFSSSSASLPLVFTTSSTALPVVYTTTSAVPSSQETTVPPPPPPPPPPPHHSSQRITSSTVASSVAQQPVPGIPSSCTSPIVTSGLNSHSLFADLVMEGPNQPGLELPLDLDLPVLEGMELGTLEHTLDHNHIPQDLLISHRPEEPFITVGPTMDVKMEVNDDVDVASWLDSLVPNPNGPVLTSGSSTFTAPWPPSQLISTSGNSSDSGIGSNYSSGSNSSCSNRGGNHSSCSTSSTSSSGGRSGISVNQSDPLLSNNQDHLDLFNLEEMDLKAHDVTSGLSWDRIDFTA